MMGQYHKAVNLDKKEYINPHALGMGTKLLEQVGFSASTADLVWLLLAATNGPAGRGGGDAPDYHGNEVLYGRWAGDRIIVVGDFGEPGDVVGLDTEKLYDAVMSPNGEYTDISPLLIPMIEALWGITITPSGKGDYNFVTRTSKVGAHSVI